MKISAVLLVTGTFTIHGAACTSALHDRDSNIAPDLFQDRTGEVTHTDLYDRLPMVLARHGFFVIEHKQHDHVMIFETDWRERNPFSIEEAGGAVAARTRLRLRAKKNGRMYSVRLEAENMIETRQGRWIPFPFHGETRDYMNDIASTLRLELASGMRRH